MHIVNHEERSNLIFCKSFHHRTRYKMPQKKRWILNFEGSLIFITVGSNMNEYLVVILIHIFGSICVVMVCYCATIFVPWPPTCSNTWHLQCCKMGGVPALLLVHCTVPNVAPIFVHLVGKKVLPASSFSSLPMVSS